MPTVASLYGNRLMCIRKRIRVRHDLLYRAWYDSPGMYTDILYYRTQNTKKSERTYIHIAWYEQRLWPVTWHLSGGRPMTNKTATVFTTTKIWSWGQGRFDAKMHGKDGRRDRPTVSIKVTVTLDYDSVLRCITACKPLNAYSDHYKMSWKVHNKNRSMRLYIHMVSC